MDMDLDIEIRGMAGGGKTMVSKLISDVLTANGLIFLLIIPKLSAGT